MISGFNLKDPEAELARVEGFQLDQDRMNISAHTLAVAHADGSRSRLETQSVAGAAMTIALNGTATVVEAAIANSTTTTIHKRRTHDSSSTHIIVNNGRHRDSSSNDDVRSISSTILGPAGLDHPFDNSIGLERPISSNNNIGEEASHNGTSRAHAIAAAR